jgi:Electron transfer DM13
MKRALLAGLSIALLSAITVTSTRAESKIDTIRGTQVPRTLTQASKSGQSGTFVVGEKPMTGSARIITENGQRFVVLDSAFSTSDQGPDLHVLLDTSAKPPQTYKNLSSSVNLGKLQKFNGEQRYPLPASIDLAEFKSVVIWCRMANATFGYAPLQ